MRSYSIQDFCEMHGICRATFYNWMNEGRAPKTFKNGRLVRISEAANAEWIAALEAASAAQVAA